MKRELVSNGNPLEDKIGFSRAVRVGPYITIGGTAPVDSKGNTIGVGDPAAQTRRCMEIIEQALEQAGAGLQHVTRTRMLLTRIEDWKVVAGVRAEYFREIKPVDTIMQVSQFINPEWFIEIEVDAIVHEN